LGDTAVVTGGSAKPPSDPLADTGAAVIADTALSDTAMPNAALDATLDSSAAPEARARRTRPDYPDLVPVNPEHYLFDKESARGGMG